MKPATALYQLRSDPRRFLENNMVRMVALGDSGVYAYFFGTADEYTTVPTGVGAPNENFRFAPDAGSMGESTGLKVHKVAMLARTEKSFAANRLPAYSLGGGPDVMVTAQLTGCSFCVFGQAAAPVVAHIQPRNENGLNMQTLKGTLESDGAFHGHNGGVDTVFGMQDYGNYASVVGVRIGERWQIYGQCFNSTGTQGRITQVVQLL